METEELGGADQGDGRAAAEAEDGTAAEAALDTTALLTAGGTRRGF